MFQGFRLPSLPREIYLLMKTICTTYGISQWQAVIAGIYLISQMPAEEVRTRAEEVKNKYNYSPKKTAE